MVQQTLTKKATFICSGSSTILKLPENYNLSLLTTFLVLVQLSIELDYDFELKLWLKTGEIITETRVNGVMKRVVVKDTSSPIKQISLN